MKASLVPRDQKVECCYCKLAVSLTTAMRDGWLKIKPAKGVKVGTDGVKSDRTHLGWCTACRDRFGVEP